MKVIKKPPTNPYYCRQYKIPLSNGHAEMVINAPHGKIARSDWHLLESWFELVKEGLEEVIEENAPSEQQDATQEN